MTLEILERFHIALTLVFLVWALVLIYRVNSELKALKNEQKRHDNIQKVVLEQVDEINQKI